MSLQAGLAIGLHRLNADPDDQPDDIEPAILAWLAPDHRPQPGLTYAAGAGGSRR